jgi:hypothetical protein
MSDDPAQPGERTPGVESEDLQDLGGGDALARGTGGLQGGTAGIPAPGGTGGIVMGGTGGIITVVAGGTGGHTITVVLGPDGRPKPGRYRLEVHHTAEFEVLDNGHVVIHRQTTEGGTPEQQG